MLEHTNSAELQSMIKEDVATGKIELPTEKPVVAALLLLDEELKSLKKKLSNVVKGATDEGVGIEEITKRVDNFAINFAITKGCDVTLVAQKVAELLKTSATRKGDDIQADCEKLLSDVAYYLNMTTDEGNRKAGESLQKCLKVQMTGKYNGVILQIFTVNPLNNWKPEFAALQVGYESSTSKSGVILLSKSQKKGYSKMASTPKIATLPIVVPPPAEVVPAPNPTVATPTPKPQVQQSGKHGKR